MSLDPFTRASPTYRNAMRYPHKTGAAYEGWSPYRSKTPRFARLVGRLFALASLALFVAMLLDATSR